MSEAFLFHNARLIDPAADYDGPGAVAVEDGVISGVTKGHYPPTAPTGTRLIDCEGKAILPGLIDMRVRPCPPGGDPLNGLEETCLAAAAGGVTTVIIQPDLVPGGPQVIDNTLIIEALRQRGEATGLARVEVSGAATPGLKGRDLAEIGLMAEAGAVMFAHGDRAVTDARLMRNLLSYAGGFNALIAHRPFEPALSASPLMHQGDLAMRMGFEGSPAASERIMLERDLALVELTGARLLVDQVSSLEALEPLRRARARGLEVLASVSINHLVFNENDLTGYRKAYLFDPPLRTEDDRAALCDAVESGLIDIVVSNHLPLTPADRSGLFAGVPAGAAGLQTLLPALIGLHHERDIPLIDLIAAVTINPAQALGLNTGRLSVGAPADLVWIDTEAPFQLREKDTVAKSKATPFENRTLTGKVRLTLMGGRIVYARPDLSLT